MRLLHTGDLHIGKIVNDFSMLEDQIASMNQIVSIVEDEKVDAVILAGDIYDRAIPPAEAVRAFDQFLTSLAKLSVSVLMISGNHDSPERISFGKELVQNQGVYIAGNYEQDLTKVTLQDPYGEVTFVLLPFVKPAVAGAKTSDEAVKRLLEPVREQLKGQRSVLVTHFFVTNAGKEPELSDSEQTIHVGGLDNVDATAFADFDYVALGHIHKKQQIGNENIYYAGAPVKFSFGEVHQTKGVLLVELGKKGEIQVEERLLKPLHDMRKIKGTLLQLTEVANLQDVNREDYIQAILTDQGELIDPITTLRSVYPNIMQIVLERELREEKTQYQSKMLSVTKSMTELFREFYQVVREEELDEAREAVLQEAAKKVEGK